MTGHEQYEELAAGHALHALEPADEQTFLTHLDDCVQCQRSLADFNELAAGLALSSLEPDGGEPPPQLWDSIRREVRADAAEVIPLAAHRMAKRRVWLSAAAAALVVAAGGLIGWQVAGSGSSRDAVQSAVSDCRHPAGCHVVRLASAANSDESAYLLVTGQDVRVASSSLPAIDASRQTYVLWQMPQAGPPAGLVAFAVTGKHRTPLAHATLTQAYDRTTAFAISRESGTTIPATPGATVVIGAATSA